MEIGCDWLSASLEWLYSILVWTKGFVFGPDLPWLKGKTSMEENRYLSVEAQDIKDKNGERARERETARYQTCFSSSDQNYHLRWKCEF